MSFNSISLKVKNVSSKLSSSETFATPETSISEEPGSQIPIMRFKIVTNLF